MPRIPNEGTHEDRLKRVQQHLADPFDSRMDHKSTNTDEVVRKAAKQKKPPKGDDGTELYKSRKSWSDSSTTGRH